MQDYHATTAFKFDTQPLSRERRIFTNSSQFLSHTWHEDKYNCKTSRIYHMRGHVSLTIKRSTQKTSSGKRSPRRTAKQSA